MDIVFFGGSFNPPHIGHFRLCLKLYEISKAPRIMISPSNNPQKPKKIPALITKEMVSLFIKELSKYYPVYELYHHEIFSKKKTYTIDTLSTIQEQNQQSKIGLALGADQYASLPSWKQYEDIIRHYKLYIFARQNAHRDMTPLYNDTTSIFVPFKIDASSKRIREFLSQEKSLHPIRHLIPTSIQNFLNEHRLYR